MNMFSQFLYTRRKALGLTQQNIADHLNVTNKAVSKWEAGDCFPETAQLAPLADILHCTVDELLHGEMKESAPVSQRENGNGISDKPEPEKQRKDDVAARPLKTWQGACIAVGVFLVLFGTAAIVWYVAALGETEENGLRGAAILFAFLSVAVFLFVFSGMSYGVTDRVKPEQKPRARLLAAGMGISIAVILLSIVSVLVLPTAIGTAIMLTLMAVAVAVIVLCGVGVSRFHLPEERGNVGDKWSGVIMLTATAVFLLCGFLWNKWHPAWVVFPIGGILCAIVSELQKPSRNSRTKNERGEEENGDGKGE